VLVHVHFQDVDALAAVGRCSPNEANVEHQQRRKEAFYLFGRSLTPFQKADREKEGAVACRGFKCLLFSVKFQETLLEMFLIDTLRIESVPHGQFGNAVFDFPPLGVRVDPNGLIHFYKALPYLGWAPTERKVLIEATVTFLKLRVPCGEV
jgi:hypothetical protein